MGRTTFALTLGAVILAGGLTGCASESQTTVTWQDEVEVDPQVEKQAIAYSEIDYDETVEKWWSYQYYYYPDSQVYYEPYSTTYYWFDNGAWYEGQKLPKEMVLRKSTRKLVKLQTNKPWTQHSVVASSHGPKSPFEGSTIIPRANVEALDTFTGVDEMDLPY